MIDGGSKTMADSQSSLDKFVLIAWCGEGVPESRKGLFRTYKLLHPVSPCPLVSDQPLTYQTPSRLKYLPNSSKAHTWSCKPART